MKRIISFFLLLLLLLPTIAQKPCTIRVVAGMDYPYYITALKVYKYSNHKVKYFDKLDNRTYTLSHVPEKNSRIIFLLSTIDQKGRPNLSWEPFQIPIISGEQLTVILHDAWNLEIGGSQLYREYGKAYHAILQQGEPAKDYIAKHRNERGCALFVLSELHLPDKTLNNKEYCYELFDSATVSFLGDPKERATLKDIACSQLSANKTKMENYYNFTGNGKIDALGYHLEGQAIIDAIGQKYKGKPTLVNVWTYENYNTMPNAYELSMHAKDMNLIYLTSLSEAIERSEYQWKRDITSCPGEHYLLTRYQVDSLFQHYMPGVEYDNQNRRQFFILLDAEGKVVDYGDQQHNYRQLIAKTDQLKAEAGLPPFKGTPYKMKYLDLDVKKQNGPEKDDIIFQAQKRMAYTDFFPIEGHETARYSAYVLYTANCKQLNISQRLYDIAKQEMEELNKKSYENRLKQIFEEEVRKVKQKDDYQPDLEKHRQEMIVGKPVDLGLSVKWADINVGAKAAEETGMYFTWGDPEPLKDTNVERSWSLYRWCKGSETTLRKYNTKAANGPIDMRTTVLPEDDAATIYWQGDWRTPSQQEADELLLKCQWEWTTQNGHNGYKVTGPNGNSIFIPAAGCLNFQGLYGAEEHGYYWTTDLNVGKPNECYYFHFRKGKSEIWSNERFDGRCIRPVCK